MDSRPSIPFHAKVRIRSRNSGTRKIDGMLGYIEGISEHHDSDGQYVYGVFVYELERVWCCAESELEPTGELDEQSVRNEKLQVERIAKKNTLVQTNNPTNSSSSQT
jgi:hypothetical protein